MNTPITQTDFWHQLQKDLKEKSFFCQKKDFQYVAILKNTPVGNYLYLPYGPVFTNKTGYKESFTSLQDLAQKTQAFFIRVEPQDQNFIKYKPKNAIKSTDLNPKETWVLDLSGTDDELKSRLPSRLIRYYKTASKKGIAIETSHNPKDVSYLVNLQKSLAEQKGINIFSEKYLETELNQPFSTLYLVKVKEPDSQAQDIIAAGLVFDDKFTRYNLQGAQNDRGRKLHATGILTIQLILDAKKKGQNSFDFWGIAPEDADSSHPWYGFTNFKKTFKGKQINYAGTYDIVLKPKKYKLYQLVRKINRTLRHI